MQESIIKSSLFTTFQIMLLSRQIIPNLHQAWSHGHFHCDGFCMEPSILVQTIQLSSRKNASKQCFSSWISGKILPWSAWLSPFCATAVNIFNPVQFSKWRLHGTLLISANDVSMLFVTCSNGFSKFPVLMFHDESLLQWLLLICQQFGNWHASQNQIVC